MSQIFLNRTNKTGLFCCLNVAGERVPFRGHGDALVRTNESSTRSGLPSSMVTPESPDVFPLDMEVYGRE